MSSVAAPTPKAVESARGSVVRVTKTSDKAKSVAFAVNDRGDLLTTSQAASRSARLQVLISGQKRVFTARKVESDAPPGLALIHVDSAPRLRALKFAGRKPVEGTQTWIVAPRTASLHPRASRVKAPEIYCTKTDDLATVGARHVSGTNGSPVVDARGQVLGVVRATRGCSSGGTQIVRADTAPTRLPELPPPARANFPAVLVVIIVGLLLLAANLALRLRRQRPPRKPPVGTAGPPPAAKPVAPTLQEDTPEITLRKK